MKTTMNEIVWDMKDKVRDQEGQISSLREELRKLQKQSDHDVEVARIEATELRSLVQGLREEIESLNRRVAILFTEMVKMKRLLAPMREEKDKRRSVYEEVCTPAWTPVLESIWKKDSEEARQVIANGGEEGYW